LRLDHQLVAPPLRRGLGPSTVALGLPAVGMQVKDPLAVVDADLFGRLRDRQRFRWLEEAPHGAAPAASVGVPLSAASPAEASSRTARPAAPAAEAAAAAASTHASARAGRPAPRSPAAARVTHLRPRVLALLLVERPLAGQRGSRRGSGGRRRGRADQAGGGES